MIAQLWVVEVIAWLIFIVGSLAIVCGLLWAGWYLIGKIIKLLGYWPLFYKALMHVAKEAHEKRRAKR